tara:strand:- start:219 stop:1025 length:807 start_codon:yes stop_codon:yes gene_type:complete
MKFSLNKVKQAQQFIELFKIIKNMNSYSTLCSRENDLFIQIMDDSHISLFNVTIQKEWFDSYESDGETFSFMSNLIVRILQLYTPNTNILFETTEDKLTITFEFTNKTEKIFELPLVDIDKDLLEPQQIEGSLDFTLSAKTFDKYISELMLFGDSAEIICVDDKLFMKSEGDEGKYTLKLPYDILEELQIEEDLKLKTQVSLKYLSYLTKSNSVFKTMRFHIRADSPIYMDIEEPNFRLEYFVAPKFRDEEEENEDYSEYESYENEIM